MKLLTLLPTLFLCSLVQAGEVPFPQCPQTLTIKQDANSSVSGEWEITNSIEELPLEGARFTYGDYSEKQTGSLIPTEEKKLSNGDLIIYYDYLSSKKSDNFALWATCHYVDSAVILTRKLTKDITRCEVRRFNNGEPVRETIKCFDTPRKTRDLPRLRQKK